MFVAAARHTACAGHETLTDEVSAQLCLCSGTRRTASPLLNRFSPGAGYLQRSRHPNAGDVNSRRCFSSEAPRSWPP